MVSAQPEDVGRGSELLLQPAGGDEKWVLGKTLGQDFVHDELKGQFVLFQNVINAKCLEENAGVFLWEMEHANIRI